MDTFKDILRDARKLHKQSLRRLKGVAEGSIKTAPGITKQDAIAILREDIECSRKLIRQLGGGNA